MSRECATELPSIASDALLLADVCHTSSNVQQLRRVLAGPLKSSCHKLAYQVCLNAAALRRIRHMKQ